MTGQFEIVGNLLCEWTDKCTCGGYCEPYWLHEKGCGLEPAMPLSDLNPMTVEWGVRHDEGRVERCSEATAHLLAAPGVTPVSRVVGPWQDTTPNPPAQTPKENNR